MKSKTIKFEPCWCGGSITEANVVQMMGKYYSVVCPTGNHLGRAGYSVEEAAMKWNDDRRTNARTEPLPPGATVADTKNL